MNKLSFDEFLDPGSRPKRKIVDLSDLLDKEALPPLDPEILSPPLALELHMLTQVCTCGASYTSPEGSFVEYTLKRLHGRIYKDAGKVLLPLPSEKPLVLLKLPHRIRTRSLHITLCNECIEAPGTYKDFSVESHEAWQKHRPPALSPAWRAWQSQVNPSKDQLQQMIKHLEDLEAYKNGEDLERRELLAMGLAKDKVDPESNLEE